MAGRNTQHTQGFVYWDSVGGGVNPISAFQCVSLATAAECATAAAAGVRDAVAGRLVIPTPVAALLGATIASRPIVGVTLNSAFNGDEVSVVTDGVAEVMVNAAVTCDTMLHCVVNATRTSLQTPFVNLSEALIPFDPRASLTYQLAMADDPALTFSSGATANVLFYPLGLAMATATAQYDVIPVRLRTAPLAG